MKKLAYAATAFASLFVFAMPAAATWGWPAPSSSDVSVDNMFTSVKNYVSTKAVGVNDIGGKYVKGGTIDAGQILAGTEISNTVNFTGLDICGDCVNGDVSVTNKFTDVKNFVSTKAFGGNEISGKYVGGGFWTAPEITTHTISAMTIIANDVNTTLFGDFMTE